MAYYHHIGVSKLHDSKRVIIVILNFCTYMWVQFKNLRMITGVKIRF